jgi:hypothetical protein
MSPKPPKPASSSQVSYAKHLVDQAVSGLKGVPGWLSKDEAPSDAQIAEMDTVAISTLIGSLKARRPFEIERFGNGTYRIHPGQRRDPGSWTRQHPGDPTDPRKSSQMTPSISRVAYKALAKLAVRSQMAARTASSPGAAGVKTPAKPAAKSRPR